MTKQDVFNAICDATTYQGEIVHFRFNDKSRFDFFIDCCKDFMGKNLLTIYTGVNPLENTMSADDPYCISCELSELGYKVKCQI